MNIHFAAVFHAMRGASHAVTAEAMALKMTFPFVTLPNFELIGQKVRSSSGIESLSWTPLVERKDVQAFNAYSQQNQGWIQTAQQMQQQIENEPFPYEPFLIIPFITDLVTDPETGELNVVPCQGDGPFAPGWHTSPPPLGPIPIMVNTFSLMPPDQNFQFGVQETLGK